MNTNCQYIVWLPVRLTLRQNWGDLARSESQFDYQSDWHCAKTAEPFSAYGGGLITSQIDTAPKLLLWYCSPRFRLITSQIDTAPKPITSLASFCAVWLPVRLTLRQNEQWGDLMVMPVWLPVRLTLRQNAIARAEREKGSLITSQIDTAPKPHRRSLLSRRVWLPVRLTLRQNPVIRKPSRKPVWLPVRLTLRQNQVVWHHRGR